MAHRVESRLDLSRAHTALLALLMLRGPQTANELLTRSERLAKFESVGDVQYALERLSQREPALVRLLPRQGGQREDRYAHLLSGEPVYVASTGSPPARRPVPARRWANASPRWKRAWPNSRRASPATASAARSRPAAAPAGERRRSPPFSRARSLA